MESKISPGFIFDTICGHLAKRDDLWHIVNGPKRETWFTAETIAALSRSGCDSLDHGFRVCGEEAYSAIAEMLREFEIGCSDSLRDGRCEGRGIPDISILESPCGDTPCFTIAEAKLVSPTSTKSDDSLQTCSDLKAQLGALGTTAKGDGLLDQLNRATRLVPAAQVLGLVFAVHRFGQCEQACPSNFFDNLTQQVSKMFEATTWGLWDGKVKPVAQLQGIWCFRREVLLSSLAPRSESIKV